MDEPLGLVNGPHDDPAKCPTYYDGCNCTVETLKHNLNCLRLVEEGRDSLLLQRDDYKAKWEKLMAAIGPYSTTDLAAKMAEGARLQNNELRRVLSYFTDRNSGHGISDDGERCKYHGVIGLDHVWPCPVAEAQRLVADKQDHESDQR